MKEQFSSKANNNQCNKQNNATQRGILFFNLAFRFVKLLLVGILSLSVVLVAILQLPIDACNRILFFFLIFPLLFCIFTCFLLSDFFFRKWIMLFFWIYILVSIVFVFLANL